MAIIKTREINIKSIISKARKEGYITNDEFTSCVSDLLISEDGYVTCCGSNAQVNAEILLLLKRKIEKHPLLWKLFFMIA